MQKLLLCKFPRLNIIKYLNSAIKSEIFFVLFSYQPEGKIAFKFALERNCKNLLFVVVICLLTLTRRVIVGLSSVFIAATVIVAVY